MSSSFSFAELGLLPALVRALEERGYTTPTPIQTQAIPAVLEGRDLLAAAQTGTGKTAGFTLPLLQRIAQIDFGRQTGKARIRVLILTPTRELAAQVEESVRHYGKYVDVRSMVMFGGVNINPQKEKLNRRIDILVATPGRLLDHIGQKTIDLSGIDTLVLDEADRMLDMGFIRDIRRILPLLPKDRQNLLFSATFSDEIRTLSASILNNPVSIEVARRNTTAELVTHLVHPVDREKKRALLEKLIRDGNWSQVLVFTRTKHGANRLAEQLDKSGISALPIHGNKSQSARERALREFKAGTLRVLVATDIAARGIDIDGLPHVVNYELPNTAEDYVHRIGRTGRAGSTGEAVSLVCVDELKLQADIEKLLKRKLDSVVIAGFEPDLNAKPEPLRQPRTDLPPRQPRRKPEGAGSKAGSKPGAKPAGPRNGNGGGNSGNSGNGGSKPANPRSGNSAGGSRSGGNASGNSNGNTNGNSNGNTGGRSSGNTNRGATGNTADRSNGNTGNRSGNSAGGNTAPRSSGNGNGNTARAPQGNDSGAPRRRTPRPSA
ncbi:MAG: DEAD/DEAH box helicase [Moraxellaceae bacterium]|nr:DEAD/DEAH box helicase [Moraxellaceae bacterium]